MLKDYYKILEISNEASPAQVKNSYKKLAKKWHPDKNDGLDTTLKMQEINEAYQVLNNKETRENYDDAVNFDSQMMTNHEDLDNVQEKESNGAEDIFMRIWNCWIVRMYLWLLAMKVIKSIFGV